MSCDEPEGTSTFRAFYEREQRWLLRQAMLLTDGHPETTEDLTQEAFKHAYLSWDAVVADLNPPQQRSWLLTCATRLNYSALRRQVTYRKIIPKVYLQTSAAVADVEDEAIAALTGEELRTVLSKMPPREKAVSVLCLVIGYTPSEAAANLGITPSRARGALSSARAILRRKYGSEIGGTEL